MVVPLVPCSILLCAKGVVCLFYNCLHKVCTKKMKKTTKDDEIKKKIVNLQAGRK